MEGVFGIPNCHITVYHVYRGINRPIKLSLIIKCSQNTGTISRIMSSLLILLILNMTLRIQIKYMNIPIV